MTAFFEILDRYLEAGDASGLLYAPLRESLAFRRTRRYEIEFEGDATAVEDFVRHTLVDAVSQELRSGDAPALEGFRFLLDYGMKPGALDLEKEAVASFDRGMPSPDFDLKRLTIRQRIYVFGEGVADPKRFIRDICNAAIHNWRVIEPAHA